jgi:hypothetical protein
MSFCRATGPLLVATLISLAGCSSDPEPAAAPPTSTATTMNTPAGSTTTTTSSERGALLLKVDDAVERGGYETPEGGLSAGELAAITCDALDGAPVEEHYVITFEVTRLPDQEDVGYAMRKPDPNAVAALRLGIPLVCPQHASILDNLG